MKKSKIEAAETRRRIVKTAAAEFRRKGINGAGVNDVMAAAGLTHGGFYRHFDSKDELIAEACAAAIDSEATNQCPALGKDGLEAILSDYLSTDHRDNLSEGCVLAGLGSELARSDDKTRAAATAGFLRLVDAVAQHYRGMKPQAAKARALVTVSAIIGAITMSRIVIDPKLSAAILRQTKKHLAAMS
jgi:TetR/AcrR family transcriptional regulator, transcriptional repressor for nem operon